MPFQKWCTFKVSLCESYKIRCPISMMYWLRLLFLKNSILGIAILLLRWIGSAGALISCEMKHWEWVLHSSSLMYLVNSSSLKTLTVSQLYVPNPHVEIPISKTVVLQGEAFGGTGHDYPQEWCQCSSKRALWECVCLHLTRAQQEVALHEEQALTRHPVCWHLDPGLPALRTWEIKIYFQDTYLENCGISAYWLFHPIIVVQSWIHIKYWNVCLPDLLCTNHITRQRGECPLILIRLVTIQKRCFISSFLLRSLRNKQIYTYLYFYEIVI